MNWLDYLLIAVLAISTFRAASKGLTREAIGLAAGVAALVLGMWFYGLAGSYLRPYVTSERASKFAGFVLVFFGVLLLGSIMGRIVSRLLRVVGLSLVDRLAGACFGLARGLIFAVALLTGFTAFGPLTGSGGAPSAMVHSQIAPWILEASRFAVAVAPNDLKQSFLRYYSQIESEIKDWRDGAQTGNRSKA